MDDETDQRLQLLVGLVVMSASITFGIVLTTVHVTHKNVAAAILFLAVIATTQVLRVQLRVGANVLSLSPISTTILITTAFLPAGWVVISATFGSLAIALAKRQKPIKIGFNSGKETLSATAAAFCPYLVHSVPFLEDPSIDLATRILALVASALGYAIIDEALSITLFALITRTKIRQRALSHLDASVISNSVGFLIAFLAVWSFTISWWLVISLPFLIYALHLASANRIRSKAEREAWQKLSQATDELNTVELSHVFTTALYHAVDLFSADEAEIEIQVPQPSCRLVRGSRKGIDYDGVPEQAPKVIRYEISTSLNGNNEYNNIGEIRLRFRGPVVLSEREECTLKTFAAALSTTIRNATKFAETQRLVDDHKRTASQDPLTLLANRSSLQKYGTEVLSSPSNTGNTVLVIIDLNHFKEVNDTLGHAAGDQLLVEVAHRLTHVSGPKDLVARIGGDEFAILLVDITTSVSPMSKTQEALTALDAPMNIDGTCIRIEASAGIAIPPLTGGIDELIRRADVAMYQAKRKGQRIAIYAHSHDTANIGSLSLGGELARAISKREFVLEFQPIVDLGTGRAIGAEALARWQHPHRGFLTPAHFIDGIERSDQLPAFAEMVLDEALQAASNWAEEGHVLSVAVNVSPRSLLDTNFPSTVENALSNHNLPASVLILELTESVTLSQLKVVDEVLHSLQSIGIRLALDDFGTGYSSLSTVARVPVYELKIDRSFVKEMDSPASGAVLRSTIELANSLDLLVVAEGVETPEQRHRLWELGCTAGQGHLFARPMAIHRLLSVLKRGALGHPGSFAGPIHNTGSVIRIADSKRGRQCQQRFDQTS